MVDLWPMNRWQRRLIAASCCFLFATVGFAQKTANRVSEKEVMAEAIFIDAQASLILGKHELAIEKFADFLKSQPDNPVAHYLVAKAYQESGDANKGLNAIDKAVLLDKKNRWFYIRKAQMYESVGKGDVAAEAMEELIDLEPNNDFAYKKAAFYYLMIQQPQKAINVLSKAEKKIGKDPEILHRKHIIFLAMGKTDLAVQELQKVITLLPNNVEYRIQLADLYLGLKKNKLAEAEYKKVIALDPHNNHALLALQNRRVGELDNNQFAQLETMFADESQSIDLKITELMPLIDQISKGNPSEVNQILDLAKSLTIHHPKSPKAYAIYGDFLNLAGRSDEAIAAYRKTLEKEKSVFPVWEQTMQLLFEKNMYEDVVTIANDALNYFPNKVVAYLYLAEAQTQTDDVLHAISTYRQASFMAGKNAPLKRFIFGRMAQLQISQKDFIKADTYLDKALSISGSLDDPFIIHVQKELKAKNLLPFKSDQNTSNPFLKFLTP